MGCSLVALSPEQSQLPPLFTVFAQQQGQPGLQPWSRDKPPAHKLLPGVQQGLHAPPDPLPPPLTNAPACMWFAGVSCTIHPTAFPVGSSGETVIANSSFQSMSQT